MTTHFTRSAAVAAAALLTLTFTACGSDSDAATDTVSDSGTGTETPAPTEPSDDTSSESDSGDGSDSDDSSEPGDAGAGLPLIAVGETVTIDAIGTFDATYLGLADLGPITTFGGDDVQCFAILGEVTLVDEGEISGPGLSPQRADVLDAGGTAIDVSANAECPQQTASDAGYPGAFDVQWTEGAAQTIRFDIVAVPVDAVDQIDRIQITPSTPEFEFVGTVTETF